MPPAWFAELQESWGELEIACTVALDGSGPIPDATEPGVRAAVIEMRGLVKERQKTVG